MVHTSGDQPSALETDEAKYDMTFFVKRVGGAITISTIAMQALHIRFEELLTIFEYVKANASVAFIHLESGGITELNVYGYQMCIRLVD